MEKKKIYIIGACRGCGATFVSVGLAFALGRQKEAAAKGITYLEGISHDDAVRSGGHSLPYYELSFDKNISAKKFTDYFALKKANKLSVNRLNLYGNVNWVVRTDNSPSGVFLTPEDVPGRFVLWDEPGPVGTAAEPDLAIVVFDTLPSRVMAGQQKINMCRERFGSRILWVMNRDCKLAANRTEKFLKIKADHRLTAEPFEKILSAEYCRQPLQQQPRGLTGADTGILCRENIMEFDLMAEHISALF